MAQQLSKYINEQVRAFHALSQKTRNVPSGKNVHKLRVASRKLREAFNVAQEYDSNLSCKRLKRSLRKLGKILGVERELEIAQKDARTYGLNGNKLKPKQKKAQKKNTKISSFEGIFQACQESSNFTEKGKSKRNSDST